MFYVQSVLDQTSSDIGFDADALWDDLSVNKKIGSRLSIKRKAARYMAKKVRLKKTMLRRIIAKAKKICRSSEKRERHCSKQLLRQAQQYM